MSVGFYLKDEKRDTSCIMTVIAFKGKYYKRSAGESVPPKRWNKNTQRCNVSGFKPGASINIKLNAIDKAAGEACNVFIERRRIPDGTEFWREVDMIMSGGQITPDILFTDYLLGHTEKIQRTKSLSTYNKYKTAYNKLREYETDKRKRLRFEDIDMSFYHDFEEYFYAKGFSKNYFGSVIKNIKATVREARFVDKLHNLDFVENRKFKVAQETADTIYLNEDELLNIYTVKITPKLIKEKLPATDERPHNVERKIKSMEVVRAKFLIGAFTALRVSDFNRLEAINLKEGYINIKTKKTGIIVTVPVHWIIREILEGGFDIGTKVSEQKLNEHIKEVARLAGITDKVEISKSIGGKSISSISEKCDLITTHTARRSGATNMVKFGLSPINVMKITGHKTWQAFMKYIKITGEENAVLLKESGFFDKKPSQKKKGNKAGNKIGAI